MPLFGFKNFSKTKNWNYPNFIIASEYINLRKERTIVIGIFTFLVYEKVRF